jgi:hypothetical protein
MISKQRAVSPHRDLATHDRHDRSNFVALRRDPQEHRAELLV